MGRGRSGFRRTLTRLAREASRWASAIARRAASELGGGAGGHRKRLGKQGEDAAASHLRRMGYRIIERNARVPMGEADIVAISPDGQVHVLVEVKSRLRVAGQALRSAQTAPEESVTAEKRATLRAIAAHLARANGWASTRIDVIAVEVFDDTMVVRHHEGAV